MLEANELKVLRKIVGKAKIDRIKSKKIRESYGIKPINEWVKTRRKRRGGELDEHVTRMDVENLVKIWRDNAGRRSLGLPKWRWNDLIVD